jgi:abequosyltransferase
MISNAKQTSISLCIPAYSRIDEYKLLLDSIVVLDVLPNEVVVCEDGSAERPALRKLSEVYAAQLKARGCAFIFHENSENLGYDANLRQLLSVSSSDYIFFIGNDDYLLPNAIFTVRQFLAKNSILAASRTFVRFKDDPSKPLGISRCFTEDKILNQSTSTAGMMLRIGGFFGGLVFKRQWALSKSTTRYDGSLFYQIYLLLLAYAEGNVGYINTPIVAARADNAPLFGAASSEIEHFTPGRYTAAARGKMWESILWIAKECEEQTKLPMLASIRHELATRMSFHVFEMFTGRPRSELYALKNELTRLGLFSHAMPKLLYSINYMLGNKAGYVYSVARLLIQR